MSLQRLRRRSIVFMGLGFALLVGGVAVHAQDNLLTNPGFEAPYNNQGGDPPRQVANGWTAWHVPASPGAPTYQNQQPEYLPTAPDATRIHNGSNAQLITSFFATFTGGVYQQVSGVEPGEAYTFSTFAYIWSSAFDDVDVSEQDGGVVLQVGIDPNGGTDGSSANIVWSSASQHYDAWNQYAVTAEANNATITVFVRGTVSSPAKNNNVYLDDAALVEGEGAPAQPTRTPTSTRVDDTGIIGSETPTATEGPTEEPTERPTLDTSVFLNTITHTIRQGDTISYLATLYGSTIDAIYTANDIDENTVLHPGDVIVIPVRLPPPPTLTPTEPGAPPTAVPTQAPQPTQPPAPSGGTTTYTVQFGDTLNRIAARFNTTVQAIAQLNGIANPNLIFFGQVLQIPLPGSQPPQPTPAPQPTQAPPSTPTTYLVQPGDTLFRISIQFNVPILTLISLNGIADPNRIFVGQTLRLQ